MLPSINGFVVIGDWYIPSHYAKRYERLVEVDEKKADVFFRQVRIKPHRLLSMDEKKRKHEATYHSLLTPLQRIAEIRVEWMGIAEIEWVVGKPFHEIEGLPECWRVGSVLGKMWYTQDIKAWLERPRLSGPEDDLA